MKREAQLFAGHKFFEETGSQILTRLAKVDFRDIKKTELLHKQLEDYLIMLEHHARWEEEFIFNKFFTQDEVFSLFDDHSELESKGKEIITGLKLLLELPPQTRIGKGKQIYLDFRKFYASNLVHFYEEETSFLSLLQARATDEEIRAIDKPIYQGMSSGDIVEMIKQLFPPLNMSDKKNILEDLKCFNTANFESALSELRMMFRSEEFVEILGEDLPNK
ncbi:hypothetical protein Lnau_1496 [Legionella nautarum]|uniref:Hemerythrin-like domain-containing protein n=1 Tax=Legionella nautarum TaxID=45070 RepID=A0A0W0WW19_9GAMM|nr:hypothetical protein [Legionella nautarum]KTD36512.1 hypothetical protein Lnau_1496 [Legionella nautarum]